MLAASSSADHCLVDIVVDPDNINVHASNGALNAQHHRASITASYSSSLPGGTRPPGPSVSLRRGADGRPTPPPANRRWTALELWRPSHSDVIETDVISKTRSDPSTPFTICQNVEMEAIYRDRWSSKRPQRACTSFDRPEFDRVRQSGHGVVSALSPHNWADMTSSSSDEGKVIILLLIN